MQTCYNCGRQVDDNVLICPDCGALVRRYGRPVPQEAPEAAQPSPVPADVRPRSASKPRLTTGAKVWLILCILVSAFQVLGFVNLFYLYGNQALFADVFAAYPELSAMQDLLDALMQSVSMFFWFYIFEGTVLLLKCAGLIWFAASRRRAAFFTAAGSAALLCILTFVTAGLMQALANAAGVTVLYLLLRRQWRTLPK